MERKPLVGLVAAADTLSTPQVAIKQEQEVKIEYAEEIEDSELGNTKDKSKSKPKIFKCDLCPKVYNQSSHLYRHYNTHTGQKKYHCNICSKSYNQRDTLIRHKETHTSKSTYYCDICHTEFKRKDYIQGHMAIHFGDRFECTVCGRLFNLRRLLKIHERIHSDNKPYCCALCGKEFNEGGHLRKHMRTHMDKQFKCDVCPKSYKRLLGLKRHKQTHRPNY